MQDVREANTFPQADMFGLLAFLPFCSRNHLVALLRFYRYFNFLKFGFFFFFNLGSVNCCLVEYIF